MVCLKEITVKGENGETTFRPLYDCLEHGLWRRDPDGVLRPHPYI